MLEEEKAPNLRFGKYVSHWLYNTPRRVLYALSYYKFASRLIGENKRVLDIGCNEGIGTYLLGKYCGFAKGIDFEEDAIAVAKRNYQESFVDFEEQDVLEIQEKNQWDAVCNFDVIEHIYPENIGGFFSAICGQLTDHGMVVIGTPSEISQEYASIFSKKGHVNIYSPEKLREQMKEYFSHVFLFSANDEVIHTGFSDLAHYLLVVGCSKKH